MCALWKAAAIQLVVICALEGLAGACPFCGGKGASGLFENLILVAALWFGARAFMRAMQRRRLRERPPTPEPVDDGPSSTGRTVP